jgi:hypothetical protein
MKLNLQHIVLLLLIVGLPAGAAMAQDGDDAPNFGPSSERERTHYYSPGGEGEPSGGGSSVVTSSKSTVKDSVSTRSVKPILPPEPAKVAPKQRTGEDDVLSFNFLYYIIRKYKLQDIVD